ncbi:MAG TPA: hypothetical protein PK252_12575 [Bacteroidales bacterium]|nr:hypothetical protein [Bacteroidales bacterium]
MKIKIKGILIALIIAFFGVGLKAMGSDTSFVNQKITLGQDTNCNKKNPYLSCILSAVLPGTGQLYNGQYDKGIAMLIFEIGGGAMTIYGLEHIIKSGDIFLGGLLILSVNTIWSAIDAPKSSIKINEKNGLCYELNNKMHIGLKPNLFSFRQYNKVSRVELIFSIDLNRLWPLLS